MVTEPSLLLSIPIKNPDKLEWKPALLDYIKKSYSEEPSKYEQDAEILDAMRTTAMKQTLNDTFVLEDLHIYFNQLTYVTSKFPLDVNLKIGWFPAFQPQEKPEILYNLNYERACVLFRIAAFHSELGCQQNWVSTEGLRKACQHFQNAAGCLKYIETDLVPEFRADPPNDFKPDTLNALTALMLAQAHECIWQKSVMEHMRHGTIARLAIKVSDYYQLFLQQLQHIAFKKKQRDEWQKYGHLKFSFFLAVAHYQKANEAISSGRYGEEVARLRLAQTHNPVDALVHSQFKENISMLHHGIQRDIARAERDNDLVYMEPVPEPSQLVPILRSDMVKPILPHFVTEPAYWTLLQPRQEDEFIKRPLFEHLLPFAVHQAASVYADKKDYIIKVEIQGKNQDLTKELQEFYDEFRLPYSLDTIDALPKKLVEHVEEVHDEGGIQSLYDMLQKVQRMSKNNLDLIEEGFNALEEENEQDALLSREYGKLWSRPSSQSLTHNLLTAGTKYNDTVQAAQKADRVVQAKVNNWGKAIEMLSLSKEEIPSHLPSMSKSEQDESGPVLAQLLSQARDRITQLDTVQENRITLEKEAITLSEEDDISTDLMKKANELTKGSPIVKLEPEQFGDVFESHLEKYQQFQYKMQSFVSTQQDLIYQLEDLIGKLDSLKSSIPTLYKRETAIMHLETAFVKFKEIRANLVEGIKFYSNYTDTLIHFRDDCNEFVLARGLEATELVRTNKPVRMICKK